MLSRLILLIDLKTDPPLENDAALLQRLIQKAVPERQIRRETCIDSSAKMASLRPDLILLRPPSVKSVQEFVTLTKKKWGEIPVLALLCDEETTSWEDAQFLFKGLDDFATSPFRENDLIPRIQRLLGLKNKISCPTGDKQGREALYTKPLIGKSENFIREVKKIPLLAESEATVLILGETGTGKELFARAIHYRGSRQAKAFIPLNCGALPDHLFENELFGHVKGAFTDASSEEKGLLAAAEGGTLFLDEVDSLSPSGQVKLLRFLQDREYRPLGSSKSRIADVRIIAATNADLKKKVENGGLRRDLYYRLNVLSLSIPPLRERCVDVPLLTAHFLDIFARQFHKERLQLSPCALQKLAAYPWPGNIRELEAVLQKAVVFTSSDILSQADFDLPSKNETGIPEANSLRDSKLRVIGQFEYAYLRDLLAAHQGNISRAALAAGKTRQALQKLLRKYGLERRSFQNP